MLKFNFTDQDSICIDKLNFIVYCCCMKKREQYMEQILEKLSNRVDKFYLAGGTALSWFYFHHRESYDLDFFSKEFSRQEIEKIITYLKEAFNVTIELSKEVNAVDTAKVVIYYLTFDPENRVKIDFVEDTCDLIKPTQEVNGIHILSKEDIYLRKVLAVCGSLKAEDGLGRTAFRGGRQEAKDYYDLFCLSTIFIPISKFISNFKKSTLAESLIIWHKTYDRTEMKLGLLDIITENQIDARVMIKHFDEQIAELVMFLVEEDD